jgi:hypothetical protein
MPNLSTARPLISTKKHPLMVAHMYTLPNVFLDIPVVAMIESVSAHMPTDCPGNPKIIRKHDSAKSKYLLVATVIQSYGNVD